jgi:hypothetical protein
MGLLKRFVCLTVGICFAVSLFSFSYAETAGTEAEITVTLNSHPLYFDVQPVLIDSRVLLPLRTIFEQLGASVEWDGAEKKATGTRDGTIVELWIDRKTAKVDGKDVELDVPGMLVDGRTMAPARFVAESFGAKVEWLPESRRVVITYVRPDYYIDYSHPEKYLDARGQSGIPEALFKEIDSQLNIKTKELSDIKKIFDWKQANFRYVAAGGRYIGKTTAQRIIEGKELTGCHDDALLMSAVLRRYGFPAIMVDATGIQFSLDYPDKTTVFSGHVFVEVYLNGRWILVDTNSGEYILDYDVNNLLIPITKPGESKGYYVMLKGIDPGSYGVRSLDDLTNKQKEYSKKLKEDPSLVKMPAYKIERF